MKGPLSSTARRIAGASAVVTLVAAGLVLVAGCGDTPGPAADTEGPPAACAVVTPPAASDSPPDVEEPVEIVDRQGHVWDITTAVVDYGFDPDRFQYGLGAGAIPALVEPDLRRPAAADALPDDEPVIGVVRGDDARAYPLDILRMHEIANDAIDGMHYAASY